MDRPIALNALFLEPGVVGGTEVYTRAYVRALGDAAPERPFLLYLSREAAATDWDLPDNVEIHASPSTARSRVRRLGYELAGLPGRVRRDGAALLHSLGTTSPLRSPIPLVVTVYDLIFEAYPEAFPRVRASVLQTLVPRMLHRADRVIAISRATADDVIERYGVAAGKISVIYAGPGRAPLALSDQEIDRLAAAASAYRPYVLSVATTQPHKNLRGLISAFRAVRERRPELSLVLVGAAGMADRAIRDDVERAGLDEVVTLCGRVDDPTLDALYARATLFVYPSLYEGFGLPLLEAMQRGVPVLASDATSLPEVGGDACAYVDAARPEALADAIVNLVESDERSASLVAAGAARAAEFSWRDAARQTIGVYDKLL